MSKVIIQIAFFRRGVEKFEKEVNSLLSKNFKLNSISVEKKGFRFVCIAVLDPT